MQTALSSYHISQFLAKHKKKELSINQSINQFYSDLDAAICTFSRETFGIQFSLNWRAQFVR